MSAILQQSSAEGLSIWRIAITTEAPNDAIRNATEKSLEETKLDHNYADSTVAYRQETLATSYLLGTVRAVHYITFTGEPEAAEIFFRALRRRTRLVVADSPYHRIIEENHPGSGHSTVSNAGQPRIDSSLPQDTNKRAQAEISNTQQAGKRETDDDNARAQNQNIKESKPSQGISLGRGFLIGLSLLLLFLILSKTLSGKTGVSANTKEAIARMHVARYGKGSFKEISRQESREGTEFQFENGKHTFTVNVDNNAHVTSWRKSP